MNRIIGLISGTSVDGIDAALVEIAGTDVDLQVQLKAGATYPYPDALRKQILKVCAGAALSVEKLAELDDAIAHQFALAAQAIQTNFPQATAIGSHGQTVYHRPPQNGTIGYSLQLGRGELIAQLTGIPTVSNFRAGDIEAGGQGAPLVPKVDAYLLSHPTQHRCVQNIGGIGNVAYLPPRTRPNWETSITGFDTGPGNSLLDIAVQHLSGGSKTYDSDGEWASTGTPSLDLVNRWLQHDYFQTPPPKSTGRELFGWDFLQQCLTEAEKCGIREYDLVATLAEFTVASIVHSYRSFLPQMPDEVLLCGGGSKNLYLKKRLQAELQPARVLTTDEVGLSADYKEAIAFAVLAHWRQHGIPGNLPHVTGARMPVLLGNIHPNITS